MSQFTRAQRKLRKQGYTHEIAMLKDPFTFKNGGKLVYLHSPGNSWREYRPHLLDGEVIRPVAATYLHNGRKPR